MDLIQMTPAYNGDQWIIHFVCDQTKMQHAYTTPTKTTTPATVRAFRALVKTQNNQTVKIVHSIDGESTLRGGSSRIG
jgi:hypothetical protein